MADYAPIYTPGNAITLTTSAAVLGGDLLVVSGTGTVAKCTVATHQWVGVAAQDAASGARVAVFAGGVQELTATGAITAGQLVEPAAAGSVAAHTNGTNDVNAVGVALTSATTGNKVRVLVTR